MADTCQTNGIEPHVFMSQGSKTDKGISVKRNFDKKDADIHKTLTPLPTATGRFDNAGETVKLKA